MHTLLADNQLTDRFFAAKIYIFSLYRLCLPISAPPSQTKKNSKQQQLQLQQQQTRKLLRLTSNVLFVEEASPLF